MGGKLFDLPRMPRAEYLVREAEIRAYLDRVMSGAYRIPRYHDAKVHPAGTYRVLVEAWQAQGFSVHALEKFGHDERFPVTGNWPHLRDQLIEYIETQADEPAYLVGHSLGGYLSLMAAARRPPSPSPR